MFERDAKESNEVRDETENSSTEELVLSVTEKEEGTIKTGEEEAITSVLGHLQEREAASIRSIFFEEGSVVAWKL